VNWYEMSVLQHEMYKMCYQLGSIIADGCHAGATRRMIVRWACDCPKTRKIVILNKISESQTAGLRDCGSKPVWDKLWVFGQSVAR
jgi:hypothetical protein